MRSSLAALLGLPQISSMDSSDADSLENLYPPAQTAKQVMLAWSCSGIGVAGTGALIYAFYSLCFAYYLKMNVFYSAAITALR